MKKKFILVLLCVIMITGCTGRKDLEEKFYNSLEKAYTAVYISDGIGLAVYKDEFKELEGKKWYKVGISKYDTLNTLTSLARDVYEEELANIINEKINTRYLTIDGSLYTTAESTCDLPYILDENLKESLKKDIKIKKISRTKVKFEYESNTYEGRMIGSTFTFKDKIFKCTN